jgi:hypothetical protein
MGDEDRVPLEPLENTTAERRAGADERTIGALPAGPLSRAEALALDETGAFETVVPAGALVVPEADLSVVVGLAMATADRVVGAVYTPDDRAWHRVYELDRAGTTLETPPSRPSRPYSPVARGRTARSTWTTAPTPGCRRSGRRTATACSNSTASGENGATGGDLRAGTGRRGRR